MILKNITNIYSYYIEYLTYIEIFTNDNDNQKNMLIKFLQDKCNPIEDKSSCLWSYTRCSTFNKITKKLFINDNLLENCNIEYLKKNIDNIGFINVNINPDHVFAIIKIENKWYYVSSWMLLYTGVIIYIEDINNFLDCLNEFFIDKNFKKLRKDKFNKFIKFIEQYFVYKLHNFSNNTIVQINNINLINQLIFRTGENMIEKMINLIKISKESITKYDDEYEIKLRYNDTVSSYNDINLIYTNFYNNYVKNINKNLFKSEVKELLWEYELLLSYNDDIIENLNSLILNYNKKHSYNKYIYKIKQLLEINKKKLFSSFPFREVPTQGGSYISIRKDETKKDLYFNNFVLLNQLFMGNKVKIYSPGFEILNDDICNIINIVKYYNLIEKHYKNNVFESITFYLFNHFNSSNLYKTTKKYYKINYSLGKVCKISFLDNEKDIYSIIIIHINKGFHLIFPEFIIDDITLYIKEFVNHNSIIKINKIDNINLQEYHIKSVSKYDYCNFLFNLKKTIIDYVNHHKIKFDIINIFLYLLYIFENDKKKLKFFEFISKIFNTDKIIDNDIIFDIIKLIFDENINKVSNNFGIDIKSISFNNYDHLFFKNLYIKLKLLL